jgi:hypothetical protein
MQSQRWWRFGGCACLALISSVAFAQTTGPVANEPVRPGMRVAIDPETKKLRPVEHDDAVGAARSAAARSALSSRRAVKVVTLGNGARVLQLDESFMSYSTARLGPDGKLDSACVVGEDAAAKLLREKPVSRTAAAGGRYETE